MKLGGVAANSGPAMRSSGPSVRVTLFRMIRAIARLAPARQFLTQHCQTAGRFDADPHLIALEPHNGDSNIRADHDLLRLLTAQNQHPDLLPNAVTSHPH